MFYTADSAATKGEINLHLLWPSLEVTNCLMKTKGTLVHLLRHDNIIEPSMRRTLNSA